MNENSFLTRFIGVPCCTIFNLVADSCVALAEMIIKHKSWPMPQSYYEAIDILGEKKLIPPEFAYDFAKISSFRNFLAHDYEKVDYFVICKEVMGKLDQIIEYVRYVKKELSL